MINLPFDVLFEIASWVEHIQDLRNFRLVCSSWATPGYPKLARHLMVLDTVSDMDEFVRSMRQHPGLAVHTKRLTLCHGEWPPISFQADFETHPLLLGGREKWVNTEVDPAVDAAFAAYSNFVSAEATRSPSLDLDFF